jgi:hypothetical protein
MRSPSPFEKKALIAMTGTLFPAFVPNARITVLSPADGKVDGFTQSEVLIPHSDVSLTNQ